MDANFYNLTQQTQGAIFGAIFAQMQKEVITPPQPHPLMQVQRGYAEAPAWFMIQAAEFDPEPLTVAKLRVRDTYASVRYVQAIMDMMVAVKWFDRTPHDEYVLTEAGRELMLQTTARAVVPLTKLNDQLQTDVVRLAELLGKIIDLWLADHTRSSWCLAHSRNRAPADSAPPLVKISQYCSDFNAYRDDAHMAGWGGRFANGIAGITYESFTFIDDGKANSAETLFEQLAYRGYATPDFAQSIAELQELGWLDGDNKVTELGRSIRAGVERATDDYFYAVWSQLGVGEADDLERLLGELGSECGEIAKQ
jgi:hypothetical protein